MEILRDWLVLFGGCYLDVYLRTFFFFWKKYKVQEWIWYNKTGTRFNKNKIRLVYFKQTLYIINFIIDPWGVGNDEIAPSVSLPLYLMDENYIIYSTRYILNMHQKLEVSLEHFWVGGVSNGFLATKHMVGFIYLFFKPWVSRSVFCRYVHLD